MNTRMWKRYVPAVLLSIVGIAGIAQAEQVYRLFVSLSGRESIADNPIAVRTVNTRRLMSWALGLPGSEIPNSYVLAMQVDCDTPTAIVVWDKSTSKVVATVGTITPVMSLLDTRVVERKQLLVADVDVVATNRLVNTDGTVPSNWRLVMSGELDDSFCATSLLGSRCAGAINTIGDDGQTNTILIVNGVLETGAKLGETEE